MWRIQESLNQQKSFCIFRKKEKNSSTGRDCILDRTFDRISFSFFCFFEGVLFFLFPNRMSFLK